MVCKNTWSCGSLEPTPLHYLEQIDARYDKPSEDECWVWTGPVDKNGYGLSYGGRVNRKVKTIRTHRAMYELYVEQIPLDLTIDHMCRNQTCGNPKHLQILTISENSSDGGNARKTHCPHGHEYTDKNTYHHKQSDGSPGLYRQCRTCAQKRALERYYKLKALSTTS